MFVRVHSTDTFELSFAYLATEVHFRIANSSPFYRTARLFLCGFVYTTSCEKFQQLIIFSLNQLICMQIINLFRYNNQDFLNQQVVF